MLKNLSNGAALALVVAMAVAIVTVGPLLREALEGNSKNSGSGSPVVVQVVEVRR